MAKNKTIEIPVNRLYIDEEDNVYIVARGGKIIKISNDKDVKAAKNGKQA